MKQNLRHGFITIALSTGLMSGCALPGLSDSGDEQITIGMPTQTESEIVGHMIRILVERETDANVEMINNLTTNVVQHQAMLNGDINVSATRYTGNEMASILDEDPIRDPDEALDFVEEELDERFDLTWFPTYGFDNAYAFAIREELAEEEGIETISDLETIADSSSVGVDNNWLTREGDGYQAFQEEYGFEFDDMNPMQIGLVYDALATGSMDIILAYTSDGRIDAYDLVLLEDDEQFFPPYDTSAVATNEVLEANPELEEAILKLEGQISTEQMQELNYAADAELREPATVAQDFLEENNYFE
ncbi:osmoprotectant ABC transporter substrate-binding protein [Natribacillus halophilus]|uniref:Osmoprotectant transport system substrate-binding protein n=1 Tax=Natribacillus halophilus TaxID=549003 RepID=A0A1G8SGM5_9BACI|nr:osmoprotectant ABC transporter substrate-binding protein [Natribacillus halophilus]SDJ27810.1 osmoprotectant transport system substrate-binding protein [Natribacillus halophilus]